MFNFLKRRVTEAVSPAPGIIAECEKELHRTAVANWQFVAVPRDMTQRVELLNRANAAGLAEHETVQRLDFLQRLLTHVLASVRSEPSADARTADALLAEAKRHQLKDINAVKTLAEIRELELLVERGAPVIAHDSQGRAVYLRCAAEFKNKPGQFEVRADGVTFVGEVAVDIPWSNVVHVAKTSHTYQGMDHQAVALQEGKRRTPTKFAFTSAHGATYACEVTVGVWEHHKSARPV